MDPATDCDLVDAMRSSPRMDFADLKPRIAALCARAASPQPDTHLLVEMEDLLAEGYVRALHGDHYSRRLQARLDALLDGVASGEDLRSLATERQRISCATAELRSELAVMREHWVSLGSERIGLA